MPDLTFGTTPLGHPPISIWASSCVHLPLGLAELDSNFPSDFQGALGPQGPPGAPGVRGFQVGLHPVSRVGEGSLLRSVVSADQLLLSAGPERQHRGAWPARPPRSPRRHGRPGKWQSQQVPAPAPARLQPHGTHRQRPQRVGAQLLGSRLCWGPWAEERGSGFSCWVSGHRVTLL